jgi:squalene-hopene/tetraprenyl-beta-curcumene cyclase
MIDPPTVDVTARVVEALLCAGTPADAPEVRRALDFLRREQEEDGSWYGRWGCNYLYGTWLALTALRRAGESPASQALSSGRRWLVGCQNVDGGWGELPTSYASPESRGRGPSTACQTGWAMLGLMAAGEEDGEALRRGVGFLLERQEQDGGWTDVHWTGTGFPEVFYLRYHLYALYFPLQALAMVARLRHGGAVFSTTPDSGGER